MAPVSRPPHPIFQHLMELAGRHPWDQDFVEKCRSRVKEFCARVPVHVHHVVQAKDRLAQAAKEAIVDVFLEEFPNALVPVKVKPDWPRVLVIIADDEALIEFSFSPETDALMGGNAIEAVRIVVKRAPPNIAQRAVKGIMDRLRNRKSEEPETLVLKETVAATPKPEHVVAESPVTVQRDQPQPAHGHGAPRQPPQATRPAPARASLQTGQPMSARLKDAAAKRPTGKPRPS